MDVSLRDAMYACLEALEKDPQHKARVAAKMLEAWRHVEGARFGEMPTTPNLEHYPLWEALYVAGFAAQRFGLWDTSYHFTSVFSLRRYTSPDAAKRHAQLDAFRKAWDAARENPTLTKLLNVLQPPVAAFKTHCKKKLHV